jgi:hypothetical protein
MWSPDARAMSATGMLSTPPINRTSTAGWMNVRPRRITPNVSVRAATSKTTRGDRPGSVRGAMDRVPALGFTTHAHLPTPFSHFAQRLAQRPLPYIGDIWACDLRVAGTRLSATERSFMNPHSLFFTSLVITALTACSSASDGTGTGEADVTVHPVGTDLPGSIVVAYPSNLSAAGAVFDHNGFVLVDGKTTAVNSVVSGLPVGPHTVTVNGCTTSVTVQSSQTTTVTLGAFKYTLPKDPTFGLTAVGNSPIAELDGSNITSSVGKSQAFHLESCTGVQSVPTDGQVWAVLPGSYSAVWGYNDGTTKVDVPSGQVTSFDLGAPAGRRLVRMHAPSSRDLPDLQVEQLETVQIRYENGGWLVGDSSQPYGVSVGVSPGATLVIGTRTPDKKISVRLPFTTTLRDLPLTQDGFSEQSVGRLDVTDVMVTLSDGSSKTYAGAWSPQAQDATVAFNFVPVDGARSDGAPTQKGLDVWPGTYVVRTDYVTVEEGQKTDTQTVVVP